MPLAVRMCAVALFAATTFSVAVLVVTDFIYSDPSLVHATGVAGPAAHDAARMLRMKVWPWHYGASVLSFAAFAFLYRFARPRLPGTVLMAAAVAFLVFSGILLSFVHVQRLSAMHHWVGTLVTPAFLLYAAVALDALRKEAP